MSVEEARNVMAERDSRVAMAARVPEGDEDGGDRSGRIRAPHAAKCAKLRDTTLETALKDREPRLINR